MAMLALPLMAACAVNRRPPTDAPALLVAGTAAEASERAVRDSVVERLARRLERRGDRTLDLLFLSGGGQVGAWGAGFLGGWRSRGDMPTFDLVTGISTGALQAPFVLQDTDAAIDTLRAIYRRSAESVAPTLDWWFWLRRTGGYVNTARFERTLASTFTPAFREGLRAAFDADRQLLVATTDFDLGRRRTWDLAAALALPDSGVARTTRLLLAATAIPGIFPPTVLDGRVHADGGVVSNVLPVLDVGDYRRLAERVRAREATVTLRLWVLANLWPQIEPRAVPASNRGAIASRTDLLLFWTHMPQDLRALAVLAEAADGIPGVHVELRIASVPSALALDPDANTLFKRRFMERLDSLGYARGRRADRWDPMPPAYALPAPPARR
jgi:hypothetical protein